MALLALLGEIVDENILDNFLCMDREFSFGKKSDEVLEPIFYET